MQITLREPDDWHLHLRDASMLQAVVGSTAAHFARALIMPNLVPPVVTAKDAAEYKNRIETAMKAIPENHVFQPLMTLYLTEETVAKDVIDAASEGLITAVKLYPAGATTNSASGVSDLKKVMPVLEAMADNQVPLCVHGEVTDHDIDIFDREARFIEMVLDPLRKTLPELRVVMEHITTREGVEYVKSSSQGLAATITTHHLMINRNHLLVGGVKPHYYCLPIAKREQHRLALVEAACSGDERIFLGTDSAPHTKSTKESACGCAGVFNAINTMPCVATVFEENQALDKLEAFTSINGAKWYGLPVNETTITLRKLDKPMAIPDPMAVEDDWIVPFDPGREIFWQVVDNV